MSFGDAFAGAGEWLGAEKGREITQDEAELIKKYFEDQFGDAQKLDLTGDPLLRGAQMKALAQLEGIAGSGGMDPQSMAVQAQAERSAADQEKSQRGAIVNDANARGVGGGGAELAAQLQAQQAGANRSAMVGQQAASDARSRALSAMSNYAALAGSVRGQDEDSTMKKYGAVKDARSGLENYHAANRADMINRFASGGKAAAGVVGGGVDAVTGVGLGGGKGGGVSPQGIPTNYNPQGADAGSGEYGNRAFDDLDYNYFAKQYGGGR